ncbi:hypothetical protein [Halorubrum sp. BV1]|nr:hypothetical protein [Halorubrum sp. BV1]
MSTTESDESEELGGEEQDLLDVAATDLQSAKHARRVLQRKYDYEEEELP